MRYSSYGRDFQTYIIFKSIFWKPLPSMGGWMGDHAHVCFIVKIILKLDHEMGGRLYELYTWPYFCYFQLVSLNSFNWYQYDIFLYTHICLCFIYVWKVDTNWNWYSSKCKHIYIKIYEYTKMSILIPIERIQWY